MAKALSLARGRGRGTIGHNRFMKLLVLALTLAASVVGAQTQEPQRDLPRVRLSAGMHQIDAQTALTPGQRATGLMWRKEMPQHEGMLFVFDRPTIQCFWMQNTYLPLSAAFIEDDGTIVNIADMKPLALDSHCSGKPVRFVLEMNQGWFAKKGVKPGTRLTGEPFRKP